MLQYLLVVLFFISADALACASFIADSANIKSGANVKHFFSDINEPRRLIIKNESNEPCEVRLETMDMLQRLDGGYRYSNYVPGRNLYRSLSSGLSIIDSTGNEITWKEIVLRPKETLIARLNFSTTLSGTSYTTVRAYFPQNPSALAITEIYYTQNISQPLLQLDGLKYTPATKMLDYTLKGRGDSYTFFKLEFKLIDPATGFEVDSFFPDAEDPLKFYGHIKNYWLPGNNDERIIKTSISINSFIKAFISQYRATYSQDAELPKAIVLYIRPRYGIDFEGWKNHHFLSLSSKTIEIQLN